MRRRRPPPPSPQWAYFLDVDGTLVNLADTPDAIRVDQSLLALIEDIYRRCGGALALVSGRSLESLDRHLRLPHLPVAGQHGLEWRPGLGRRIHRHTDASHYESVTKLLEPLRRRHPGLRLENKGATLAIHYRLAPRLGGYLHRLLRQLASRMEEMQLQSGKRVVELKPAGIDKGSAILEFMRHPPFTGRTPVFIGDDLTDEHGFEVINTLNGISIKVGAGKTKAHYRLADVTAVQAWLKGAALISS